MLDSLFLLHKSRKIFFRECEQPTALTCLYPIFKRSHIMLIFGFIFLITTRKCLHALMYKNKQKKHCSISVQTPYELMLVTIS